MLCFNQEKAAKETGGKCLAFYFAMFMYRIRTSLIISFGEKKKHAV